MSGRFTFTAGNTLTAAQLNTNVMDGIPFKMVAGQGTITASLAVTWPSSFTTGVTPVVVASLHGSGNNATSIIVGSPSATGTTFYAWAGTVASATARTFSYHAIQMTSTTGTGNS